MIRRSLPVTATLVAAIVAAAATPASAEPRVENVAAGLEVPWELAFLPNGPALVTERPGRVRLLTRAGRLRRTPAARVRVSALGEGGLLGFAVHSPIHAAHLA